MSTLTLTLRQPAQLGDKAREDFVLSTMSHVPGSVVRGALAARWIARNGVPSPGSSQREAFIRLFEGGVRFGALLRPGTEYASLAVAAHKYEPEPSCHVVDYDQARADEAAPSPCRDCDSPLEARHGLTGEMPALRRRTSVSIGEDGVAAPGMLFTRETLPAGQSFTGTVIGTDADLAALAALGPVRIGGRRTTHGLADVTITDGTPPGPETIGPATLILRLRSPGIFTDDEGRPRPQPSGHELETVLGVRACVVRRWTRWQEVGGWHAASGLPKPAELAVCAGSAFLIQAERSVDPRKVDALARRGVGLRRHEGFGDLAPPPVLREGLRARQEREARHRRLMESVAPLMGVPVRWKDSWPRLRTALAAHVTGDGGATRYLRAAADGGFDTGVASALRLFLEMPHDDAAQVAVELGRL